jgi:hypothetical protein
VLREIVWLGEPGADAREYGIPAVFGTVRGTVMIRDGQMVGGDGDTGLVRLLD